MAESEIKEGMKAPEFALPSSYGGEVTLSSLKGKIVVLYFYPKDNTPGCIKEACSFRDANLELQRLGAVVYGVSKDSLKSHFSFTEKYTLNFPLLSDPEAKTIAAYGAWKNKLLYGKTFLGIERRTVVIDKEGVIRKIWPKVKVAGHSDAVLAFVRTLT